MQLFVRNPHTMIAAAVQGDADGITKRSHYARLQPTASASQLRCVRLAAPPGPPRPHGEIKAATAGALNSERTIAAAAKAAGIATPLLDVGFELYTERV